MKIKHNLTGVIIKITRTTGNKISGKIVEVPAGDNRFQVGQKVETNSLLIGKTYSKL